MKMGASNTDERPQGTTPPAGMPCPAHGNAAGLSFGARGWTPDANAADPHLFRGRLDRPCDVCGMPDRNPLHDYGGASPQDGTT
jgi:hypothetical protein